MCSWTKALLWRVLLCAWRRFELIGHGSALAMPLAALALEWGNWALLINGFLRRFATRGCGAAVMISSAMPAASLWLVAAGPLDACSHAPCVCV